MTHLLLPDAGRRFVLWWLVLTACVGNAHAANVPPPPELLPKDTVLMVTAPDFPKAEAFVTNSAYGKLWNDPAMRPFRDKFMENFSGDLLKPLEQTFGLHASDLRGVARGQVTYALIPSPNGVQPLLLIDARDRAAQLRTNLAGIVKKWTDAGKPVQTQKIREVDFTTITVSSGDFSWDKIFPKSKPTDNDTKPKSTQVTFGQSDSLLVVGESPDAIEKILNRQAGGLVPALVDDAGFQADYDARFRNAPIYAWANFQSLSASWSQASAAADDVSAPHWDTLLTMTGLSAITSAAFSCDNSTDGTGLQIFVRVPEEKREGVLQMLAADAKDSSPPPFIGADCAKFWRWRLNIPRSWQVLEKMLTKMNPQIMGLLNVVLQNAGKDKDEHYDLKSELLSNLGDDIISWQRAPEHATVSGIKSPPALYLIGSPNPDRLAAALKVAFGFLSQGAGGIVDREFLGRKIYAAPMSGGTQGEPVTTLSFAASGSYVAISTETDFLEQYLRSGENPPQALADLPGFRDAAQKVGGMNSGWFGYESQAMGMRPTFDLLRSEPQAFSDLYNSPTPVVGNVSANDQLSKIHDWADFTLLPSFNDVSRYFYWSIYSGGFSPEGFTFKLFAPTPPALR